MTSHDEFKEVIRQLEKMNGNLIVKTQDTRYPQKGRHQSFILLCIFLLKIESVNF